MKQRHGAIWEFSHALIRETLYEDLVSLQRRSWHRIVAEILATAANADPDQVSYHYQQAQDKRAVEWLIRAAQRAERAYDWHTAVDRFEAVLPLLDGDVQQDRLRGWIFIHLARLLRNIDAERGLNHSEHAYRIAKQSRDRVLSAVALGVRGHLRCFVFNTEVGVQDIAAGVRAGQDLTDTEWLSSYRLQRSVLELCVPDTYVSEQPSVETARITSEPVGLHVLWLANGTLRLHEAVILGEDYAARLATVDEQLLLRHTSSVEGASWSDTYLGLGTAYTELGRPLEARIAFDRAFGLYRQVGHHALAASVLADVLTRVQFHYQTDDLEERDRLVRTATELYGAGVGAMHSDFSGEYLHTRSLYLAGRWVEAQAFGENALVHWHGSATGFQEAPLGILARRKGRPETAWRLIRERYPDGPRTQVAQTVPHYAMETMRLAVDLALDSEDLPTAREWLEAHNCWLDESGAVIGRADESLLWARYYHLSEDITHAREQAEQALALATNPRQPLALIAVHRFLGRLHTETQQFDQAEQHLQESIALADACQAPFERALTLLELAALRLAERRSHDAMLLLDEVQSICEPLEATPTLARVDSLRQQLSALDQAPPRYPDGLTHREIEVLQHIADRQEQPADRRSPLSQSPYRRAPYRQHLPQDRRPFQGRGNRLCPAKQPHLIVLRISSLRRSSQELHTSIT